ncbi:MAG: hypothetical protein QNJ72_25945 [Pleurocapsa sp. MO_226.B13]|nr:hypothetical protein [Pleurocapsa sp. MO_226.B13]
MNQSTLDALVNSGYYLYALLALQSSDKAGRPLVWLQTQKYSATTNVTWSSQYQAYTSFTAITSGNKISVGFSTPIEVGQLLTINQQTGTGDVTNEEYPIIGILNKTNTQFTCGFSEQQDSTCVPVCALPLYGNGLQLFVPLPKILLMFSTVPVAQATVIDVSYGPGVLIDLNNANQRAVSFDINNGWSWGGYTWAQSVQANSNLVPLLIEYSEDLASLAARILQERTMPTPPPSRN